MAETQSMQTAISKSSTGGLSFSCGSPGPGRRNHSGQWWQLWVHRRCFQEALPEMNTRRYTVQNCGSPTSWNNLNQIFSLFCIESLTSSVTMVLSVIALMGSLLLTKIWKAVAVTILRRTGKNGNIQISLHRWGIVCLSSFTTINCDPHLTSDEYRWGAGGCSLLDLLIHIKQLLILRCHIQRHEGLLQQRFTLTHHEGLRSKKRNYFTGHKSSISCYNNSNFYLPVTLEHWDIIIFRNCIKKEGLTGLQCAAAWLVTCTVSRETLDMFWGNRISMAAAFCFWAWRYFSVVKSATFMMTQRRVSTGSSAERASATTMAPRQPG